MKYVHVNLLFPPLSQYPPQLPNPPLPHVPLPHVPLPHVPLPHPTPLPCVLSIGISPA